MTECQYEQVHTNLVHALVLLKCFEANNTYPTFGSHCVSYISLSTNYTGHRLDGYRIYV